MKKLFFLISALIFPATIGAFDFNYIDFGSPGKGRVSHSEITLSSQTTTTISTSGAQFAEIKLSSTSVVYWYRADGSTQNVRENGFPVIAGETPIIRVVNENPIGVRSSSGSAVQLLRVLKITPK